MTSKNHNTQPNRGTVSDARFAPQPGTTVRWNPTPEQLMILEEMYRGGIRTPNAHHIQQIAVYLTSYGKIEGKNVFYWFQNRKARDREKLRRKLLSQKNESLGTSQEISADQEMQGDLKSTVNSTLESCTSSSITEREWEITEVADATTRPLKTLELFPTCSGNLSDEKQIYGSSLSDRRLFVEDYNRVRDQK